MSKNWENVLCAFLSVISFCIGFIGDLAIAVRNWSPSFFKLLLSTFGNSNAVSKLLSGLANGHRAVRLI